MNTDKKQLMKDFLESRIDALESDLKDFIAGLDPSKDVANQLSWGMGAFESAAELQVCRSCLGALNSDAELPTLYELVIAEMRRGAESPKRSTSPTSNLIHQCETAAWARMVRSMRSFL